MWWLLGLLALAHYSNKEKEAVKPPVDLKPKTELDRWLAATPPSSSSSSSDDDYYPDYWAEDEEDAED